MENHTSEIMAKVVEELSYEWKSKMCLIARCATFFSDVGIVNDFLWHLEKHNAVERKDEDGICCYRLKAVL
jgi:hypothetical protein